MSDTALSTLVTCRYAMAKMLRTFSFVLFLSAASFAQTDIYVSPTGNDTNPGTITEPLQSISTAMSKATAGTTIYLLGGVYELSSTLQPSVSGTAGNYVNLWAYPGEKVVLDFSGESYSSSSRGFKISKDYWYLKGLDIRNAGDNGIYIEGAHNIIENCSISYCKDTGIQISNGGSYNYIHNCDAFDNNDPATGGQNADGIDVKLEGGPGNVIRGCRVFDNADDGYDCYGTAYRVVFDSCWAFHNGYNLWNIQGFTGNGNGFKLGGADSVGPHIVTNCVSFDNTVKGFDQNNNMAGLVLYNCTSFRNGTYNYSFPETPLVGVDTLKNDLSFEAGQGDARVVAGAVLDSNSWQGHTVTAADFLSLDTTLARLPRLADGSLPQTALFRLAPGSDLINAGTDVGLPFQGKAPDIGAFESGTGPVVVATNGSGGGDWKSTSTWFGGVVPDTTDYVAIMPGDSVTIAATDTARTNDFTILSGAKLNDSGKMIIKGMLTLLPNSWFYNGNPNVPSLPHAAAYSVESSSYYVHTNNAGSKLGSAGYDSTFGNVIMLRSGTTCGASLTINGNLVINTGGATNTFRATDVSIDRSLTETVKGNVSVISGQWSCVDGGSNLTGVWNVAGNVTVGDSATAPKMARMGPLSSSGSSFRLGIFNISGNLHLVNGARLQAGSSTSSTSTTETGIINLGGNFATDSTSSFSTNSLGVFALNFVGSTPQLVTLRTPFSISSSTMQPVVNDTIPAGSSVLFASGSKSWSVEGPGSFVVNGTLSLPDGDTLEGEQIFELNDGATLGVGSPVGLDSSGGIRFSRSNSFSSKANYVFNGSSPQVTGAWLPDTVHNFTSVNQSGVTLTKPLSVTGMFNVAIGRVILGPNDIVAQGIAGGSQTRYVVTDSTGMLKVPGVASSQVLFPVGTSAGYAPAWVTNGGSAQTIGVSVSPDSAPLPGNPARVNLKWNIVPVTSGGGNYALQFGWTGSAEDTAFADNRVSYAKIFLRTDSSDFAEAGSGSNTTQLTSAPYTVSRGGVTELGTFVVGNFGATAVKSHEPIPAVFRLYQNYPNPFNPTTMIKFSVAKRGNATVRVYNILGQMVTTLFSAEVQPGKLYSVPFNAGELSSGVYFGVLESGGQRQIHKMVLLK